jgi:8-oxo-dGTP pyrophosphatase MutT (NUDIX family)
VYRRVNGEVLYALVHSRDPVPVWVWPSGHLEPDETASQAATREVREETGIAARKVAELPGRSFKRRGEPSTIAYFLMEYTGERARPEGRAVAWVRDRDARALLAHPESIELLNDAQAALLDALAKAEQSAASSGGRAAELLMKDYDALTRELEQNETRGETRLSIYLTIVTAVIAGLVTLIAKGSVAPQPLARAVGAFSLGSMLALGLVLFLRILKRDEKTDGFVRDLNSVREIVRTKLDPIGLLAGWSPFKPLPGVAKKIDEAPVREIGGLADLVAVINSILVGGLVLLTMGIDHEFGWGGFGAVVVAVGTFVLHVRYRKRRARARS